MHSFGDPLAAEETVGVALLGAIRKVFAARKTNRIRTVTLLEALVERDDEPWADWWGKDIINDNSKGPGYRLARLLKPFGVRPRKIRIGEITFRGFRLRNLSGVIPSQDQVDSRGLRMQIHY